MKITFQQQKFVINDSKTLSSRFLRIKVLVGPTIPVKAACNHVIMVSLTYKGLTQKLLHRRGILQNGHKKEAILINSCTRIFTWGTPPPGKNTGGKIHRWHMGFTAKTVRSVQYHTPTRSHFTREKAEQHLAVSADQEGMEEDRSSKDLVPMN